MKVTYCDWCGEEISGFPYVVRITHRHPFFGNTSKEYEVCEKCAESYQHPLSKEVKRITGTVKVDGEKLVRMEVREAAAYLDSYKAGAEAALLEELKRAGAITYTAETGFDPREPLGGGRYSASVDVVMPKTAKEEATND